MNTGKARSKRRQIVLVCLLSTLGYVVAVLVVADFEVTAGLVVRVLGFAAAVGIAGWLVDRYHRRNDPDSERSR